MRFRDWSYCCAGAVVLVLSSSGCDKKEDAPSSPAAAASSVAAPPPPPTAMVTKYTVDAAGKTSIDMPAPKEHIKADTTAAAGDLKIDLMNLANSRGEVKVDLTTLKTHTFGDDKDAKQTEHALNWLEVGTLVTPDVKEKNRWVVFAIESVDGLSATDLTKVAPDKGAGGDVRTVSMTVHGDFLLHEHKVKKDAAVEVKFHYPAGAAADAKPTSLDITSKTPLHVALADHDVKPRDNFGKLAQGAFGLLGTKVAETADISLDLHANVAP